MKERLLELFFERARVVSVQHAAKRFRKIRLTGPAIKDYEYQPGQQVRLQVNDVFAPSSWRAGLLRTYSVWTHDETTLELCVLEHGVSGPGAEWARQVQPGDEVWLTKPEGRFTLRPDATYHLFIGEETASVAFGSMLRALPAGALYDAVVEVDSPADQLPLDTQANGRLTWLHRQGAPAAGSESLLTALRELELPAGTSRVAYVAGEARTVQAVRAQLVQDRGWQRRSVLTKPFWTPGKRGLE
ncbi:SIP domain-containing protein [Kribbella solani]|uniref:NADPH-dependent ferric siderophore reductase n=1 Tax=Kribbella solani TaxID=236067 RepID=A0A841DZ07_9ACTN|nr:NADPH-dependent ferric siderophore reductase [Kribbella solani]